MARACVDAVCAVQVGVAQRAQSVTHACNAVYPRVHREESTILMRADVSAILFILATIALKVYIYLGITISCSNVN